MTLQKWDFDTTHSNINFWVRHLVVSKVHGTFTKWSGSLSFDPAKPETSSVEVSIDAASVDTRDAQRDGHLRTKDFLDVEKFPTLTFKSTKVEKSGDHFKVTGDLTIRGVTRPTELDVELGGVLKDPWGKERGGFSAKTSIARKDFGMEFNQVLDQGGLMLGEKVDISIDVEATRAA